MPQIDFGAKEERASLYFHIPFCTKKCPYCHFYVIPDRFRFHSLLREALLLEWERQKPLLEGKKIVSLYFGGGTPTLFGAEAIGEIITRSQVSAGAEITIEVNPEESSKELFSLLRQVGVNRLSLGVQSLDDRSLQTLGRLHSALKAKEAIFSAHQAGFENISIDLMYDLPDQTESSWLYTLKQLEHLPIQHLSLYNLTIEPHTSFAKRNIVQPEPKKSLRLLEYALHTMEELQFDRYEISAFAKPNFESRHNLGYWTFRPFLGMGPSAFSYWEGSRLQNTPNLQRYYKSLKNGDSPISFEEKLPYPQNLKEKIAIGLRLKKGVILPDQIPAETEKSLHHLREEGFLTSPSDRWIALTEKGKLFYDSVASELI